MRVNLKTAVGTQELVNESAWRSGGADTSERNGNTEHARGETSEMTRQLELAVN